MFYLKQYNFKLFIVLVIVFTCATASSLLARDTLVDRGNRMLERGQYEKAITFFQAAINQDGSNQKAWDGYQKAILGRQEAAKNKLNINEIPRSPKEMTREIKEKIEGNSKSTKSVDETYSHTETPTENSVQSFSYVRENPWKGLSVFEVVEPTLLNNANLARQRYNEERKPYRCFSKDKFGTGIEAIATYVPMNLYKYLAVALGAERGWSYKETEKRFVLISKYARKYHEFAIDLREVTSPRKYPFVKDVAKRTTLVDDNGNVYKPVKWAGPSQETLRKADTYSVCFPQRDENGTPIEDKAKKYFYLQIKGLGDSRSVKRLRFNKELFVARGKK